MFGVLLALLLAVASLIYLYLRSRYGYWRSKGLAQPSYVFGFGNFRDVILGRRNVGEVVDEIYHSFPDHDAVGIYDLATPELVLRSPALVQKVLVSDFSSFHDNVFYVTKKLDPYLYMDPFCLRGEEWKPARAKTMTAMTSSRVKEVFPLMKETVGRLICYLDQHLKEDLDAKEVATLFTMDNVSNSVFGISSNCFTDPDAAFRKMADIQMGDLRTWWKMVIMFFLPTIRDWIGYRVVPKAVSDYVEKMMAEVLEYRTKNNVTRNDIFQYLLKKDKDNFHELVGEGMLFFIEGFETSSMVACSALYELALNDKVQQKLFEEVHTAYENNNGDIDYETVNSLPYLDQVLKESMRIHPIAYVGSKLCTKHTSLDINGKAVPIEPGTPVLIPYFSLHRDPRYFPNPGEFDPERFSNESKDSFPQYVYMPFGEGPRTCPGIRFGLTQVKLMVASVVYRYRILRTARTPAKLTLASDSLLYTCKETRWITVEKRK